MIKYIYHQNNNFLSGFVFQNEMNVIMEVEEPEEPKKPKRLSECVYIQMKYTHIIYTFIYTHYHIHIYNKSPAE